MRSRLSGQRPVDTHSWCVSLKVKRIFGVSYKTVLYRLVESDRESAGVWGAFPTPALCVLWQDAA